MKYRGKEKYSSSKDNKKDQSKVICYNCKESDHYKSDCPQKKKDEINKKDKKKALMALWQDLENDSDDDDSDQEAQHCFMDNSTEFDEKKSCQNVRVPRVLSVIERELYGWVDEEIFTQPSVIEVDALPELRHEMRLTANGVAEGDYVLEAAGPSDRLPFRAPEDRVPFLWVYSELFTRLGV
ncbi:hypothetical protein PIB30_056474 [Stylosanthes scabra]|uniref:CCHC-type domain-containing protein n=1 Tax=Stylosanthes scabra TaxID=79078 RepID=A0ABU6ZI23_9FABA|nr:hypothetical protein [Stylosanthes scabra]